MTTAIHEETLLDAVGQLGLSPSTTARLCHPESSPR